MPKEVMDQYELLKEQSFLDTEEGEVNAIHAGSRVKKLLQLLTGAVYDQEGNPLKIHDDRYELVMELVEEREHSIVVFNWRHEREALQRLAEKNKISMTYIDGTVAQNTRGQIVDDFQEGKYQMIAVHPQAAGHGLTLTRATTTIWASPTYNAEHWEQTNARMYRAGQTQKTEIIKIAAKDTAEEDVYKKLEDKYASMTDLLNLMQGLRTCREPI